MHKRIFEILNKKGTGEKIMLSFLISIVLTVATFAACAFFISGMATGSVSAETAARNLGAIIDVVGSTPYNVDVMYDCPGAMSFKITENSVTAATAGFMSDSTSYYFIKPAGGSVSAGSISSVECSDSTIHVSKKNNRISVRIE